MSNMLVQIEMTAGTKFKYEFKNDELVVDRVLKHAVPLNYGFVPNTLCADGDPLDVFVLSSEPIVPNSKVFVKVLGVFKCVDNGEQDDKLLAVVDGDFVPLDNSVLKYSVRHYLENYKSGFKVQSWEDGTQADKLYLESVLHD